MAARGGRALWPELTAREAAGGGALSPEREGSEAEGWVAIGASGLLGRALAVPRRDVAYWKHLFESYEDLAIVRTVESRADGTVVIAVLVPPDSASAAGEVLADVSRRGSAPFEEEPLPAVCAEDWFLSRWTRPADAEAGDERGEPTRRR